MENNDTKKETTIREKISVLVGEASVCWSELPKGIFNSSRASQIIDEIYSLSQAELFSQLQELKEGVGEDEVALDISKLKGEVLINAGVDIAMLLGRNQERQRIRSLISSLREKYER